MNNWILEIILLLILLVANGLFAMAEIAVVSARKSRLRAGPERQRPGPAGPGTGRVAQPIPVHRAGRHHAGGYLAGAYGGATLSEDLAAVLARVPLLDRYAEPVAFALVVAVITYLSLIIGELVPKRLGLSHP